MAYAVPYIAYGLMAASAVAGGVAAKESADYNSQVGKRNAKLAQQKAAVAGAERARQARLALSRQHAVAAAKGIEFTGSALDVAGAEAVTASLEQRFIAHGGQVTANDLISQAQLQRKQGRIALGMGIAKAGSTLLTGDYSAPKSGTTTTSAASTGTSGP